MNQTDGKRVLAIFVGVLSTLCVKTCSENHFPDSLSCINCPEGWYVTNNYSRENGFLTCVSCDLCRKCKDIGQITVSNCTQFTDTQCMDIGQITVSNCTQFADTQCMGELPLITLYGCSSAAVAVFMLALIMAVCFIRISKSGASDESSAGEPFHVKDAETV